VPWAAAAAAASGPEAVTPQVEDDVGAEDRVTQHRRLLDVEMLGLVTIVRVGEVKVAGDAQQVTCRDNRAGAEAAWRNVGLKRAQITTGVKDHRDCVTDWESVDPQ
jgi:hypothetical protein